MTAAIAQQAAPITVVWMPVGRDASLIRALLLESGLPCAVCVSVSELCSLIAAESAGAAIIAEETLNSRVIAQVRDTLAGQPSWSHLPIVLLTAGGTSTEASLLRLEKIRSLGGMVLLERPLRKVTLLAAVRSALESRQRQFQTRDHIYALQQAHKDLTQANFDLQQFAFAASHDLQEPLRTVNIFTQLLLQRVCQTDDKAREFASYVQAGVKRMQMLLADLLRYSRAVHETPEDLLAPLNLSAPLEDALRVLKLEIASVQARIRYPAMPVVKGNQTQLSLVFQNLFSNSLKYSRKETTPEIEVTAETRGSECVVCVRDNGIGFEQMYAERIFDLFQRLNPGDTPGTGLGLAISRRIIQRHGGKMWAESEPDKGAAFFFTLPLAG